MEELLPFMNVKNNKKGTVKSIGYITSIALFVLFFLGGSQLASAQDEQDRKVIQLSGIILNADSTDAVAGVNIYVPTKGRGTSSNRFGYFSMPVIEGDSVVFSFIGLERQHFKIPAAMEEDKVSLILTMMEDEYTLGEVEVLP